MSRSKTYDFIIGTLVFITFLAAALVSVLTVAALVKYVFYS
jgi:hypothetical protein